MLDQLAELNSFEIWIVQTSDVERRRLERNLHDAAQQAVLTLSYDIRLAMAAADASGPDLHQLLQRAMTAVQYAVDELRQLAHGIYPAELTELVSNRRLPAWPTQHRSGSRSALSRAHGYRRSSSAPHISRLLT